MKLPLLEFFITLYSFELTCSVLSFLSEVLSFSISCRAGPLVIKSLSFCLFRSVLISPSFFMNHFSEYRFSGGFFLNFVCSFVCFLVSILKVSSHYLLASMIFDEKLRNLLLILLMIPCMR